MGHSTDRPTNIPVDLATPSAPAAPASPASAGTLTPSTANSTRPTPTLEQRLDSLRAQLTNDDFLRNRGLSNEVGFHIFAYPAARELDVRAWTRRLTQDSAAGHLVSAEGLTCTVHERNLWQVFLSICEDNLGPEYQRKMEKLEQRRGSQALLERMQKIASAERYVREMDYAPHKAGDLLLITGVGQVYPFMRVHNVLENAQHVFDDMPVLVLYPGSYNGRELSLFGRLNDGNYYRAFAAV